MDTWTDRLSEYLDGDLDAATERELEAHLAQCASCRATLDELRRVVAAVQALPDREPAIDRWSSLRGAIEARQVMQLPVSGAQRESRRRTFVLTVPQAAAAGLVLALGWGGSLWLASRSTPVQGVVATAGDTSTEQRNGIDTMAPVTIAAADAGVAATATPAIVSRPIEQRPVAAPVVPARGTNGRAVTTTPAYFPEADYAAAVADLEQLLEEGRGRLDTATVRVLERSLRSVDRALREARAALESDPGNSYLNDYLAQTMKRKLELLRRAADIVAAT